MVYTAETTTIRIALHRSGVVDVENSDVRQTEETTRSDIGVFRRLTNDQALPAIWDVRKMAMPTPRAWLEFMKGVGELVAAIAVLVDDESSHVVASFLGPLSSLQFPTRMFVNHEEAYEWALQFVPADFSVEHLEVD